jgi:hypothetical protein
VLFRSAGPAIANEYVNATPAIGSQGVKQIIDYPKVEDPIQYLSRMKSELSELNSDPAKWIFDRASQEMKDYMMGYGGVSYSQIDPDIRNMKSITEATKMRMYYERRAKRQYESQKESLTHRIAEYVGLTVK